MESTVSVSKGVFLFNKKVNKKLKTSKKIQKKDLFETYFKAEPWYLRYNETWKIIETEINTLNENTYSVLLNDIVNYIKSFYCVNESIAIKGVIPSATLLTGVNQPDHVSQFSALVNKIRTEVTPHIAMVGAQDAPTVKHLMENVVWQLINESENMDSDSDNDEIPGNSTKKVRKNQCTMNKLKNWYQNKYEMRSPKKIKQAVSNSLVIIIPDFESFNSNVLQDFVMIMSSYVSSLPIIFVFGVATSVSALHKSFPYHVSSKLLIKVFHSHSSPVYMNQVLENIFLTHTSPFHLSAKALELLTDVFLFYDFSVTGLIQSIKYCMMEHYYGDNIKSLCCQKEDVEQTVAKLTSDELESIRQLHSFRPFLEVQDCETKIALFEDDSFFKEVLSIEIAKFHDYMHTFYLCVRILLTFVKDLPRNILGKTVREVYIKCATEHITSTTTFKECMQFLSFQSQVKLVEAIKNSLKVVNTILKHASPVKPLRATPTKNNLNNLKLDYEFGDHFAKSIRVHLMTFLRQIESANTEATIVKPVIEDSENVLDNRYKLKEKLLKATRADRTQSEFEMVRSSFLSYLEDMLNKGLLPPHTQPFHEIFFFTDVSSVRKQIVGSPRGALHTALSNPSHYLQCSCCQLSSAESVVGSLPDVCVAYKLHRECGRLLNLFDWLQAFVALLQPAGAADEDALHDPALQARFTRAVAELQFLGFIKSSKRKTDHVMRLTW